MSMSKPLNDGSGPHGAQMRAPRVEIDGVPSSREDLVSAGLLEYWRIILKRKYVLLSFALMGALIGFLVTVPQPFLFDGRTVIEMQNFNQNFMNMAELDPQSANYLLTDVNIATQIHMLESGTLKSRVLERLNRELAPTVVPEFPGVIAKFRRVVQDRLGRTPKDPVTAMNRALATAARTLDLQPIKGTRLIEITCRSTIPDVAAAFANAIANEYIDQSLEQRMKSVQRTTQWFTAQLQDAKDKLEKSEARLHTLNPLGSSGVAGQPQSQQDSLVATKMFGLQQQLAAIQAERITKEAQYQIVNSASEPERAVEIDALAPYRKRVEELERNLATLNATLTPAHYKVKHAEAELADARAALDRERALYVQRLRTDLEAVRNREKMLLGAYNGQLRISVGQSGRALEYSLVQREVESNRQLYQLMLTQVNQANVASAVQTNPIRIVEPAEPRRYPTDVMQGLAPALGAATGLILAFGIVVVMHHVDRSVRTPGHAGTLLNVRELGVIPSNSLLDHPRDRTLLGLPRPGEENVRSVELVTLSDQPSLIADSFRSTLASILIPNGAGVPHVIVMTSPNLKEGKSTVTSNLGVALTELGRRVLLIDADLRRPRLHYIFNVSNALGLSTVLQDERPIGDYSIDDLAQKTELDNLRVMAAGPMPASINALLYSDRLQVLLRRLRKDFDTILIDTPPMVQFADARVLARWTDGVILVLRSGVTDRSRALAARERLAEDGTLLIGCILNDWRPTEAENRYYRQYHAYYSQRTD